MSTLTLSNFKLSLSANIFAVAMHIKYNYAYHFSTCCAQGWKQNFGDTIYSLIVV